MPETEGVRAVPSNKVTGTLPVSAGAGQATWALDRWGFPITVAVIALLSACHTYYLMASRMAPSTDEAHYMSGALSIAEGLRSGTLSGAWHGYQNALGYKAPLVCVPAGLMMLLMGGLTLPCMLSLVLTFAALGFASYSLFRHCFRPFQAAMATTLLLTMPMITGLTHRLYVELLLVLLCVLYLDVMARGPWLYPARSALAGAIAGLGVLCKVTFPALVALPTLYSLWLVLRVRRRQTGLVRPLYNLLLGAAAALLVAGPWYARNWEAVLHHARLVSGAETFYYPHWFQVDISVGPWFLVFCAAAAGFPIVIGRLLKGRGSAAERHTWMLILLLGLTTAFVTAITTNKGTRFTATWLPMLACLAVAAWQEVSSIGWSRYGLIAMTTASTLFALNITFGYPPLRRVRIGDLRIIDSQFPLNIPGWYDDNHPVDRREFRLAEAEEIIARDARSHSPIGRTAEARTTTLSLQLNFDYFQVLATAHQSPVHYLPWPGSANSGPNAPDYLLGFEGFEGIYPGAHFFNYYPSLQADVSSGRVPYRVLAHLEGPSQTGIWVYAKTGQSTGAPVAGPLPEATSSTGLVKRAGQPLYNLERIGDVVNPFSLPPIAIAAQSILRVEGWAVDRTAQTLPGRVEAVIDGKSFLTQTDIPRQDVADHFKVPAYSNAGFAFTCPAISLGKGWHELKIRVISHDKHSYWEGAGLPMLIR